MKRKFITSLLVGVVTNFPAFAESPEIARDGRDVTSVIQTLVNRTPSGGILVLPEGRYRLSGTIAIDKPISIRGTGLGTQIYEQADATMFRLTNVNGAVLSNMYLGSAATSSGTSLIELVNSYHNRIDNITMLGSNYGLHLKGSLLNTIIDLRSGTNFQGFFAATSITQTWVYAEAFNYISANANTFLAPVLEGGVNGFSINDNASQGSLNIFGGTVEGVKGAAVTFNNTFLPSSITGTHFEANGSDVSVNASSNITLDTVLSLSPNIIDGTMSFPSTNIRITGGIIDNVTIGKNTSAIRVENVSTCLSSGSPGIVNNNSATSPYAGSPLVILSQIVRICNGRTVVTP